MTICQSSLPVAPWSDPVLNRLPGIRPVAGDWLLVDEAYAAQMALRARLLAERRDAVLALTEGALEAAQEYLQQVLAHLPRGFSTTPGGVLCPDGRRVLPDPARPLESVNALVQEDVVILQRRGAEHVMTAALVCFPAAWTLSEKIGRPLTAIHDPVPEYAPVAPRVQRLFDLVQPGRPMWRANALMYANPALHQPFSQSDPRQAPAGAPSYVRSERQTILRLPRTDAVAFVIHTSVVPWDRLSAAQRQSCPLRKA